MHPPAPPCTSRRAFLRAAAATPWAALAPGPLLRTAGAAAPPPRPAHGLRADVLVIGGSFGGVAAALAAARMGRSVILTEETDWIGGQATTQGVPLDEHPWMEKFGRTRTYAAFREGVRDYYRRHYPLSAAARRDPLLNPGAGWVSKLCFEPRVGLAVLYGMLAPHLAAGRITILTRHRPVAVAMERDHARAVTVRDERSNRDLTLEAPYILDATELGELLELGGVESVVGAESQAETGEYNALEGPANPRDQMAFTHLAVLDHRPGEEHVIDRPADYDRWRSHFRLRDLFGVERDYYGEPTRPGAYRFSAWNFRRLLCAGNFEPGAFPGDLTSVMWINEYRRGVLLGVSAEERRRSLDEARRFTLSGVYWLQTEASDPETGRQGFPGLRLRGDALGTEDGLAQYPYIRESRRLRAEFTILEQHFRNDQPLAQSGPVKYPDSVGVSGYRIDIHKPAKRGQQGSMTASNHGRHWVQQIPLGALLPVRVENLLPACKNLGVTAVTNGAFRLHPAEWNIGEAAGALAAFCVARGLAPRQVRRTPDRLADFQRELVRLGVELDWPAGFRETGRSHFSHHKQELKDADTYYFGEAWRLSPSP
ncbi:MAG: FAD-dependent oxidoreductase [Opitutaceae bacterium]